MSVRKDFVLVVLEPAFPLDRLQLADKRLELGDRKVVEGLSGNLTG